MNGLPSGAMPIQADPVGMQRAQFGHVAEQQHENDFAAAVQRSAPVQQLDAQPASTGNGIMAGMTNRLDAIAAGLRPDPAADADPAARQVLSAGDPASAPAQDAPKPRASVSDALNRAIDSYRNSVVFSIEAQVASTGSTSSTKTFNDLMKGS